MPVQTYDPKTRSAFLQAAIAVAGSGQNWTEAHKAAQEAGYKGSEKALVKMIRGGRPKRGRKPKPVSIAAAPEPAAPAQTQPAPPVPPQAFAKKQPRKMKPRPGTKPGKKRGRPAKLAPAARSKAQAPGGFVALRRLIDAQVKARVAAAVQTAIDALQDLK